MKKRLDQAGFGLLDSLLALTILGSALAAYSIIEENDYVNTQAKIMANDSYAFSAAFARYINQAAVFSSLTNAPNKPYQNIVKVFTPQTILNDTSNGNWPPALAYTNIYKQTPCLITSENLNSGEVEAIMLFSASPAPLPSNIRSVMSKAALLLGNSGALVTQNQIIGNSGWVIDSSSPFISAAAACGGAIPKYSVAVNLDAMLQLNQRLQPAMAITRLPDQGAIDYQNPNNGGINLYQETLAGHILNSNTLKADIYLLNSNLTSSGSGIVSDNSQPNNPIKLALMDNGLASYLPTLGITDGSANTANTNLLADAIGPAQLLSPKADCQLSEIGKIVQNAGVSAPPISASLARDSLVCSQSSILCPQNATHSCYLPSVASKITFQNNLSGIQDANGNFSCPSSAPFLDPQSIAAPSFSQQLKVYTDLQGQGQVFSVSCINHSNCIVSAVNLNSSYRMYTLSATLPTKIITSNFNGYNVPVGFTSLYAQGLAANDYHIMLGKIFADLNSPCFSNEFYYGGFNNSGDNNYYHYIRCTTAAESDNLVAIASVSNLGVLNIARATCSTMPYIQQ